MNRMTRRHKPSALPGLALLGSAVLVSACATNYNEDPPNALVDVTVDITFDERGCPQSVSRDDFLIDTAKRVVWQSVDGAAAKVDMEYEIFFDPFKGQPLKSNSRGRLRSPPFDRNAPATNNETGITYKYSIVGDNCKNEPKDPRFRLRR